MALSINIRANVSRSTIGIVVSSAINSCTFVVIRHLSCNQVPVEVTEHLYSTIIIAFEASNQM